MGSSSARSTAAAGSKSAVAPPSNRKSTAIGSFSFTRSVSSRYNSFATGRSDAASCTSVAKKPDPGAPAVDRRVLSDITNVPEGVALPEDQRLLSATPRKISIIDGDSRDSPHQLKRNSSVSGKSIATALRCGGRSISKTKTNTTPIAPECMIKNKIQAPPKKKKKLDDAMTSLPWSRSPPSKLSSLRRKILDKVAGKSIGKPKNQTLRSISKDREFRRLSMVIRSEQELLEKSKEYEEKVQRLQRQCLSKESEIENVRNVGKMLGKLCVNQAEELKALKGVFPPTLREVVQLRDVCQKQEKELRDARTVVPSLQEQVKLLTAQLDSLANDIEKVKAARLARRAITSGSGDGSSTSTKSTAGSNSSSSTSDRMPTTKNDQPGVVNAPMTDANLEALMRRMNITSSEEKELTVLEEKCASAFRDLEKFRQ